MSQAHPAIHEEITEGLNRTPARIASKYFYDPAGSALFERITRLVEYYPTRTEHLILNRHGADIASHLPRDALLIEPGAGNCEKARRLCALIAPRLFVPIDISAEFLREAAHRLRAALPGIPVRPLAADITRRFALPAGLPARHRVVFYPGASIGNFDPLPAQRFLRRMRDLIGEDGSLLVGVDLLKDTAVLETAYNDAAGITAAFNRNILSHLNRLVGSNFEPADWHHRAFFNSARARIEMHLEAAHDTLVRWRGGERRFREGERIHTENSYKYSPTHFSALLSAAGFRDIRRWTDPRQWYGLFLARP